MTGATEVSHAVDLLGLLAGTVGVCIAIWLQMVARRRVRARYVLGFLVLGTALMLANLRPVWPFHDGSAELARAVAYIGLLAGQLALARHVWDESETPGVRETFEAAFGGGR